MPTQQPDYGWTVPVSSDMLNAGAVAIQTLADDIAATLLTMQASIDANTTGLAAKADLSSFQQYHAQLLGSTWTAIPSGTTWQNVGTAHSFSVSPPGWVFWIGSCKLWTYKDPNAYGNPRCYVDLSGPVDSIREGTPATIGRQTDNDVLANQALWACARITGAGTVIAQAKVSHHISGGQGGDVSEIEGMALVTPR